MSKIDPEILRLIDKYDESSDDETEIPTVPVRDSKKKYFDGPTQNLTHFSPENHAKGSNTLLYDKYLKEKFKNTEGVYHTISVALPGSLLQQFTTEKEMTELATQIARYGPMFQIDEFIIYSETGTIVKEKDPMDQSQDFNVYFANILQYIETPPYLRTLIFPKHPDFKFVSGQSDLLSPHHAREDEVGKYREGIVVENKKVLAGVTQRCFIDLELEPSTRVTLQLFPSGKNSDVLHGAVVDPAYPREKDGIYWGYKTRVVEKFSEIWTDCPYSDKYDFTAYVTDEGGMDIDSKEFELPPFRHVLLVFGGVAMKNAIEVDDKLVEKEPEKLFNATLNGSPNRFTKSVYVSELLPNSLAVLRKHFVNNVVPTKPSILKKRRFIPKMNLENKK